MFDRCVVVLDCVDVLVCVLVFEFSFVLVFL